LKSKVGKFDQRKRENLTLGKFDQGQIWPDLLEGMEVLVLRWGELLRGSGGIVPQKMFEI
jgi:hypothetical protein